MNPRRLSIHGGQGGGAELSSNIGYMAEFVLARGIGREGARCGTKEEGRHGAYG